MMTEQANIFRAAVWGEVGIQFSLQVLKRYSPPELIGLPEHAGDGLGWLGFTRG